MKTGSVITILTLSVVVCYGQGPINSTTKSKVAMSKEQQDALLEHIRTSKAYSLSVAEAMPDAMFDFKPVHDVRTFEEQVHHIAYGILWWKENFVFQRKMEWNPPAAPKSKAAVINYLKESYASFEEDIKTNTLTEGSQDAVYATLDHITHHRGQLIVYLRMKQIAPPEYKF